jgi:hypothetical protein
VWPGKPYPLGAYCDPAVRRAAVGQARGADHGRSPLAAGAVPHHLMASESARENGWAGPAVLLPEIAGRLGPDAEPLLLRGSPC